MESKVSGYLNDYPNIIQTEKITDMQKDVLSLLLFHGRNCNGTFPMSYSYIAKVLDTSSLKITIAVGFLEDLKFITIEKGSIGERRSQYTINYDVIKEYDNELSKDSTIAVKTNVNNRTKTEMNVISSKLESIEKLLSTKLDKMIEILQSISVNVTSNVSEDIPDEIDYFNAAKTAERIAKHYREQHNLTDK